MAAVVFLLELLPHLVGAVDLAAQAHVEVDQQQQGHDVVDDGPQDPIDRVQLPGLHRSTGFGLKAAELHAPASTAPRIRGGGIQRQCQLR